MKSNQFAKYLALPNFDTSVLETILYADSDKVSSLAMYAMFNEQVENTFWQNFWNTKKQQLVKYLQSLRSSLDNKTIHEIAVSVQQFINGRNCNMPGRFQKSGWLGFSVVGSTPEFTDFNAGLTAFIQEIKPAAESIASWLPSFSGLSSVMQQGIKNLSELSPLQTFLFVVSCQALAVQAGKIPSGAVLSLSFNGNLIDESGNDNSAVGFGVVFIKDRFGNNASAGYFANNAYARGTAGDLPPLDRTVSYWYKPDIYNYGPNLDRGGYMFGYGGNVCDQGQSFFMALNNKCSTPPNSYDVQAHCLIDRTLYTNNTMFGSPSEWTHIAVTSAPSGTIIFINGEQVATNPAASFNTYVKGREYGIAAAAAPTSGMVPYTDVCGDYFRGGFDDLRVYPMALPQEGIRALYNETQDVTPIIPPPDHTSDHTVFERPATWIGIAVGAVSAGLLAAYCIFKKPVGDSEQAARTEHNSDDNYASISARNPRR